MARSRRCGAPSSPRVVLLVDYDDVYTLIPIFSFLLPPNMPAKVTLAIYDLSGGLASTMSMGFLGFQVDAVYHTGVVVEWPDGAALECVPCAT